MGWVRERINAQVTMAQSLVPLWNTLRDSVGNAITEYNALVSTPSVEHSDCRARGPLCLRVSKPGHFIEVFMSEFDQKIKLAQGTTGFSGEAESPGDREVCGYRLREDGTGLEFCGSSGLSSDEVARLALEEFLFTPSPTVRHVGRG